MPGMGFSDELKTAKEVLSSTLLTPKSAATSQLQILHMWKIGFREAAPRASEGGRLRDTPPAIHAVGVGRKIVEGKPTDTLSVRVYVTRKALLRDLPPAERAPATIDGLPTDVIEAPPADFLSTAPPPCTQTRMGPNRPLVGGISTSHVVGDTGTLAYFCRSTHAADSQVDVFLLSNAHIYANYNSAQPGDALIQPGVTDGGTAAAKAAGFHRSVPLLFGGALNYVDAAIGMLDNAPYLAEICSIGPVNGVTAATEDDEVAKHGRTTGYTEGIVDDALIDFIMLPSHSPRFIKFKDQMRIVPRPPYPLIAKGGDSGSLVVKRTGHEAVGLLHSAAPDGSYAYANHINQVLKLLQITLM